jgi:hypothetical protein
LRWGEGKGLRGRLLQGKGERRGIGSVAASRAASLYVHPTEEEGKGDAEAAGSRGVHSV